MKEKSDLSNDTIVITIMFNLGLYKDLDKKGILYEKTAVGDKYVFENMVQNGHGIGGEQSGHIIFRKYAATGDGILTSLMLMEVMLEKKMKLSDLRKDITIYPQLLKNVRVADKPAARQDEDVVAAVKKVMVEAETDEICERYVDEVIAVLVEKGHVVR